MFFDNNVPPIIIPTAAAVWALREIAPILFREWRKGRNSNGELAGEKSVQFWENRQREILKEEMKGFSDILEKQTSILQQQTTLLGIIEDRGRRGE